MSDVRVTCGNTQEIARPTQPSDAEDGARATRAVSAPKTTDARIQNTIVFYAVSKARAIAFAMTEQKRSG